MEEQDINQSCVYYEACSAPLCPAGRPEEIKNGLWYPGEEICRKQNSPPWVKTQKKIAKKLDADSGCFTVKMLSARTYITKNTKGLTLLKGSLPDQETAWCNKHTLSQSQGTDP